MRIVVDAMGSDTCPVPDVEGAVLAAREYTGDTIVVVGDDSAIRRELAKHQTAGLKLEIVHAAESVTMEDKPTTVGKDKPNSSMHVGMGLVRDGQADAFVSAGNTGAVLTIALLHTLKRIRNVRRPALSTILRLGNRTVTVLDVGANAEGKPEWLAQYAVMGAIYARQALGLTNPRVALLSNGEEESKGTELIHQAAELIRTLPSINFVGNVEPKEALRAAADVVVTDGFTGNILIKTAEASTSLLLELVRDEIRRSVLTTIGGILSRRAFRRVRTMIDPFEIGGAPLLGVNGVVIKGHGRSNAVAIKNGVRQARAAVAGKIIDAIRDGLQADESAH